MEELKQMNIQYAPQVYHSEINISKESQSGLPLSWPHPLLHYKQLGYN